MQVASGEMDNTLCRETPHFSRLVFLKPVFSQGGYSSRMIFLKISTSQEWCSQGWTLKSASLFDAVAHADTVAQIACEGERWILRLKGSNGCKSLCR
mgnify:CR=1 FL=1